MGKWVLQLFKHLCSCVFCNMQFSLKKICSHCNSRPWNFNVLFLHCHLLAQAYCWNIQRRVCVFVFFIHFLNCLHFILWDHMNGANQAFCCVSISWMAVYIISHLCECKQLLVSHFRQQPLRRRQERRIDVRTYTKLQNHT